MKNIEPPSETASEIETVNTPPAETKPQTNPDAMPAFRNPTEGKISSVFGGRVHPVTGADGNFHTGIDIAGIMNQTVISAAEGKVIKTSEDSANGKYVIIEHTGGYTTAYAHLNKICVTEGEYVDNNTKKSVRWAKSGIATGVHLHFEIKKKTANGSIPKILCFISTNNFYKSL
ncbi:MAG: M23 family metallopeptidase [Clostridiales bacterium]|nr:MAG: M23 family metallopeptidase [Clostridiales bacterium]